MKCVNDSSMSEIISLILAIGVVVVFAGSLWNRIAIKKGIGWQFIRYTVISISIPLACVLALNNVLTGEAATLIGLALGYCFGKKGKDN